ncbi:DUF5602 domain-containing protein [Haladaptatus sp. T7]|uniref:DUF5602 domain-containing protein n=1 Tax=Haladaptatus sp. T7 TaxID=2029368 RepID=UPI0021A2595E|nr:DUF5602 domain-containing protein [Haladaptatus sp. T7]GKZ14523.1 hypothetical protein HAL_24040 [Haladaptatus sp. T7]
MQPNRRTLLKTLGVGAIGAHATLRTDATGTDEQSPPSTSPPERGTTDAGPPSERIAWGPPAAVGNGTIRTFVASTGSGKPRSVGVRFSADALEGLPTAPTDGKWNIPDGKAPCCGHETVLGFPETAASIPFRWFMLNWNPTGHPPPDVYAVPHFDFHFYLMPREKRTEIRNGDCPRASTAVTCETLQRGTEPLPSGQRPPDYESLGAVEPGMGNHLMDLTAPEFNGEPFTHTFLWGTFDGELIFFEPMVTRSFFRDLCTEIRRPITMPTAFPTMGWYPTAYAIRYSRTGDAYAVSLESFRWFGNQTNGRDHADVMRC